MQRRGLPTSSLVYSHSNIRLCMSLFTYVSIPTVVQYFQDFLLAFLLRSLLRITEPARVILAKPRVTLSSFLPRLALQNCRHNHMIKFEATVANSLLLPWLFCLGWRTVACSSLYSLTIYLLLLRSCLSALVQLGLRSIW